MVTPLLLCCVARWKFERATVLLQLEDESEHFFYVFGECDGNKDHPFLAILRGHSSSKEVVDDTQTAIA